MDKFATAFRHAGKIVQKARCVVDYNSSMGTADNADMVISTDFNTIISKIVLQIFFSFARFMHVKCVLFV